MAALGASRRRTLYIIDGHSQFFRAYHAIRTPMKSPVTGEPTNATFGFTAMLLKLLRERKPDYLAVAIDVSGDRETFRSEIYPEYKAHRPPAPEDFHPQVERCVQLLQAAGAPVLGVAGFEADDVIATIVKQVREREPDVDVAIVSKDKDLQQLIDDSRVVLYDPKDDSVLDEAALREAKRIGPGQVVDMLALMGDSVDNVPGVEGVGPKTAAALIGQFGSLDGLMARAGEIAG